MLKLFTKEKITEILTKKSFLYYTNENQQRQSNKRNISLLDTFHSADAKKSSKILK